MILESLRYWAEEYRVDGFRFDLAAVFFRGERGERLERSPLRRGDRRRPDARATGC